MNIEIEQQKSLLLDHLSHAFSRDKITMEEYERLVESVAAVKTSTELQVISRSIAPYPADEQQYRAEDDDGRGDAKLSVAIFSGSELKGRFRMGRKHQAVAVFGGVEIDLRDAEIPRDGLDLSAYAVFGGVDIVVPDNVNLVVQGMGIMGGFSGGKYRDHIPGAPLIRVRGLAVFGGVEVKTRARR